MNMYYSKRYILKETTWKAETWGNMNMNITKNFLLQIWWIIRSCKAVRKLKFAGNGVSRERFCLFVKIELYNNTFLVRGSTWNDVDEKSIRSALMLENGDGNFENGRIFHSHTDAWLLHDIWRVELLMVLIIRNIHIYLYIYTYFIYFLNCFYIYHARQLNI